MNYFFHNCARAEVIFYLPALRWRSIFLLLLPFITLTVGQAAGAVIVDTGQSDCYSSTGEIDCPGPGQPFYGQDAQYHGISPRYRDNGDGTVTDLNTGLMWSKGLDGHKVTPEEGEALAAKLTLGGYSDWRVPNIKELYSLIDFRGNTGFHHRNNYQQVPNNAVPFINTDYFDFAYGDVERSERYIDAQWLSSTRYVSTTMDNMLTVFGVNFADGRIKGYGYRKPHSDRIVKTFYVRYVRGQVYGYNNFVDNGDDTVTDNSTGLMWTREDSSRPMNWKEALAYAENLNTGGYNDWRLPNAKELQYIVDYSRSPDTTGSPAIAPVFQTTVITNEAGQKDYPFFWSSTTHLDGPRPGSQAAYVSFGRAIGQIRGRTVDVHGAGAQRSDPKSGSGGIGSGPQGDARRVQNYVRCVRGGTNSALVQIATAQNHYPYQIRLVKIEHDPGLVLGHEARELQSTFNGEERVSGLPPGNQDRFVSRLDRDGDGRVSRSEFDGPPDRFDFHDRNRDGYLTEEEAPHMLPPSGERP